MRSELPRIEDIPGFSGKRVIVRFDFNVPLRDGAILDDFRIQKELPTINFLKEKGAKIIGISHLSSGGGNEKPTLASIAAHLSKFVPDVSFHPSCAKTSELVEKINTLRPGAVLLLENLRMRPEEESNGDTFAHELSELADIYVNEAFSASHRAHASIVGVPKYLPHYAGMLFSSEIENLSRAFTPAKPFYVILGGVKFSTKLPLLKKFLPLADKIFIYGALAHNFYKAKGLPIGKSVFDIDVTVEDLLHEEKIVLPTDVVVQTAHGKEIKEIKDISPDDIIFDAGPQSVDHIAESIKDARMVLWNGPLGNYEYGFKEGTEMLAKRIAHLSAFSIVGGGDTVASIQEYNLSDKFGFVSTGGGAMLEFLGTGTLPGIEALK